MLCCPCRRRKQKCRVDVVVGDVQSSSPQTSVNVEKDLKQDTVVPDTPGSSATTVSASAEAPKEKPKKASWWRRWPSHKRKPKHDTPVKEDVAGDRNLPSSATERSVNTVEESKGEVGVPEASSTPDTPVSATETGKKKKKAPRWLFSRCKKQKLESPAETDEGADKSPPYETAEVDSGGESTESDVPDTRLSNPSGHGGSLQIASYSNVGLWASIYGHLKKQFTSANIKTLSTWELLCLGFPNLAQTCYLNATLQGLLTLSPFVQEVYKQQRVWKSHPKSQLMSVNTVEESKGEVGVPEASSTPDTPVSATETGKKKKKAPRWLFSRCKKQKLESPAETDEGADKSPPYETAEVDSDGESTKAALSDVPDTRLSNPSGHGGSLQIASYSTVGLWASIYGHLKKQFTSANIKTLSREELLCLGFPNLAQTCYLNATLQGLLTLSPFVQEVYKQQRLWKSHPKSQLMRGFAMVEHCHFSNNKTWKKSVLAAFKETVAGFNSEYVDDSQKDAHEFLSCVLDKLRSLSFDLQVAAVDMGISYTCPVNAHIAFQMLSTRTCNGCGMQSMRVEDYISLSVDLVPKGSVSQSLQEYLKERQLKYQCKCGAEDSSQQCSFLTLPNVLILQLKRFRFTRSFKLEKLHSPIVLSRELMVDPESSITKESMTAYSLVSIVSHLGSTAHSGHYVCDGAYPEKKQGDKTDRWLTYNDTHVSETTGASACHQRRRTAYMLFYVKQQ